MKHYPGLIAGVAVAMAAMLGACASNENESSLGRDRVNGGELMSRSDSQDYIKSLLDNNTYIDLDPSIPASLGEFSAMDSTGAQYRVALYRIYSATKINDGLLKLDATPAQLNISPRVHEYYRKMLEERVNTNLVKLRADGNAAAVRQILSQFDPKRIDGVIHPTN